MVAPAQPRASYGRPAGPRRRTSHPARADAKHAACGGLVATELLLGRHRDEAGATPFGAATTVGYAQEQVLVVADKPGSPARLGMPVDRVIGLVPGQGYDARKGEGLIVERRPVDGRIVHILDPMALIARGAEVIESATN